MQSGIRSLARLHSKEESAAMRDRMARENPQLMRDGMARRNPQLCVITYRGIRSSCMMTWQGEFRNYA